MDMGYLIIEGNSVYEIDEECMKNRRNKEDLEKNINEDKDDQKDEKTRKN